jgi:hypothetical protein
MDERTPAIFVSLALGGVENPRPDCSTPFQKRSVFFVDLIND